MIILLLFVVLFVLITLSVPIGISLGAATAVTLLFSQDISLMVIAQNAFAALDSFPLMAIPFFILAGNLMSYGGVSKKLLTFTDSLIGHITGGLGAVTTLTCMFFAAISGSGPATVSAIGSFMMPAMKEQGYAPGYGAALTSVAGAIGVVIPPSIPFVIYGVTSGASIGDLFIAGIVPGVLIGVGLLLMNYIMSKKLGYKGSTERPPLLKSFIEAIPSLTVPVVILGGIYAGIFTPTEAAVIGVVYALFIGKVFNKSLNWDQLKQALIDTVLINGATTFMIGLSASFAGFMTMKQVPALVGQFLLGISDSKILILLLINLILLLVGLFIDNISATVILTPILLPIVVAMGVSPIHFGIIMTMNLAIGFSTPPYGANIFVASAIGGVPVEDMVKHLIPFIAINIVVLLLVTFIPGISMGLLGLLR